MANQKGEQIDLLVEEVAMMLFQADCPNGAWIYAIPSQQDGWRARAREIVALVSAKSVKARDEKWIERLENYSEGFSEVIWREEERIKALKGDLK